MSSRDSTIPNALTPLSEQAAYWWVTLRDGECTDADRSAFAQWVTRSPERVEAYLRVASFMAKLRSRDLQWPDDTAEALIASAKAEGAEVVHLPTPVAREEEPAIPARLRRLRGPLAATAALLSLVATVAWLYFAAPHRYQTAPGEQRTVALSDGSFMTLSPSTAVEVDYHRDRRLVHIPGGEALFQVAHEAGRPFEVIDPRVIVRAVGTRFHVDCRQHQTTITVLDGSVVVERRGRDPGFSPLVLDAAEQVVIRESGDPSFSRLPGVPVRTPDRRRARSASTDEG